MTDLPSRLAGLRRPRLLIRAARFGLSEYRRTPALRRLFAAAGARTSAQIVATLLEREADLDSRRRAGDAAYSVARHVEVLIALMAEARLLPPAGQSAHKTGRHMATGASGAGRRPDSPDGPAEEGAAAPTRASLGLRACPGPAVAQPKASGISALRRATNASSASSSPASSVGAS